MYYYFLGDLELLKTWRDSNARKSREIVSIWETTVGNAINKLGKESNYSCINAGKLLIII